MADSSNGFDFLGDQLRKNQLLQNLLQQQQQPDLSQVAGSTSYQPFAQPQQGSYQPPIDQSIQQTLTTPQTGDISTPPVTGISPDIQTPSIQAPPGQVSPIKPPAPQAPVTAPPQPPPQTQPQTIPQVSPLDLPYKGLKPPDDVIRIQDAEKLRNLVGNPLDPKAFHQSKLLKILMSPVAVMAGIGGMKSTDIREAMNDITRKGYARAESDYQRKLKAAEDVYGVDTAEKKALEETFKDKLELNRQAIDAWKDAQEQKIRIAEAQEKLVKENKPTYRPGTELIKLREPDGTEKVHEGLVRDYPDGRVEYIIPGRKDPVKNEDVISATKAPSGRADDLAREIEVRTQAYRDANDGEEPDAETMAGWYKDIALRKGQSQADRQRTDEARKAVTRRINDDFIKPIDKRLLDLEAVQTTINEAMGSKDPTARKNAIAKAIAPLEAIRGIVGSGRVAVSEYPIISKAPGKPQSMVAYLKNLLGTDAPVSDEAINDLASFINAQIRDARAVRDIASKWNYKGLDAKAEEDAIAAGKEFDKELNAFQNPEKPKEAKTGDPFLDEYNKRKGK